MSENMNLFELASDFECLSVKQENGLQIAELLTHSGYKVICRIPVKSSEETKKLTEKICREMIRFKYPEINLKKVRRMKVNL